MLDVLWKSYYGLLFDGTRHFNSCLYLFALDCSVAKNRWAKWLAAGSYLFLILWIATEGVFLPHVARRFDTTLDKFGIPDTNIISWAFYLNILLGILLIIKYLKVKQ